MIAMLGRACIHGVPMFNTTGNPPASSRPRDVVFVMARANDVAGSPSCGVTARVLRTGSFKKGGTLMQPSVNGRLLTLWIIVLAIIVWPCVTGGTAGDPTAVEIQRGSVTFDVGTNLLSLSVHGTSDVLRAIAHFREGTEGLVIEQVEATVPIET